ncbi:MAG: restriction endonuclease subunit S [Alteromonadaceae bacterium]|nr:restriction endonuclease subunit S [Alteromonadaceae bacterium]
MAQQVVNELPSGWNNTQLKVISSDVSYGYTASSSQEKIGPHLLRITDIQNNQVNWSTVPFCQIDEIKLPQYKVEKDDLLFARTGATVGKSYLVNGDVPNSVYASYLIRVRCFEGSNIRYMAHFFNSPKYWNQITEFSSGIGQPSVNGTKLKELQIPLAPLAEQKRIVEKLDSLLAQVDTIQQRLNNLPEIIKRFRQSVLAAAVSGKLTEQWRGENKTQISDDDFHVQVEQYRYDTWIEEKLRKYKEKDKLPKNDTWKKKYIAPVTPKTDNENLPNGWIPEVLEGLVYISARIGWKGLKASEYTEEGPLFLSVHGLNYGQYVDLDKSFHISEERYLESPEIMLKNEDILLCKDGAGIGKIGIVRGLEEKSSINSSLLLIRAGKFFNTKFLFYFLSGPTIQALVQERMTGRAVPHLFQRDVKEFVLSVPPIEEQTEIVRLVEQYFALADTLEKNLSNAKQRVDNLTQSILAKAFKGQLVPQDPSDEPADKLLERFKAARAEAESLEKAAKKVGKRVAKTKTTAKKVVI